MDLLDQRTFSSTSADGEELLKTLIRMYRLRDQALTVVRAAGIPEQDIHFSQPMTDAWPEILRVAAAQDKMRALVQRAAESPNGAANREYFARLLAPRSAPDPAADHFAAAVLHQRRSLVDRVGLREHVKDLVTLDGPRVLMVSGGPGVGKSHTWMFISFIAERTRSFTPHLIDASRWVGGPMTAFDLAGEIATQLGWTAPPVPDPNAQELTAVRLLTAWFIAQAQQLDRQVWVVFDSFDDRTTDLYAQNLLGGIAVAANRAQIPEVRVSLLGFGGTVDPEVELYAAKEPLDRPRREDYARFFQSAAMQYGVEIDDATAAELVVALLGEVGDGDDLPMAELGLRAGDIARTAFGPGA